VYSSVTITLLVDHQTDILVLFVILLS
jgi:hypothetical protein